jgi:hypothetical protein
VPPLQKSPDTQSASPVQDVRQLVEPHRNGAHEVVVVVPQAPDPLQVAADVATPATHVGLEQMTEELG